MIVWKPFSEKYPENLSFIGTLLSGVGAMMIGAAACWALYDKDAILERILELRDLSKDLKHQTQIISSKIDDLSSIVMSTKSNQIVNDLANSREQINEDDLKKLIPLDESPLQRGQIYLPKYAIEGTLEFLNSDQPKAEKQMFVMKQLKTKD